MIKATRFGILILLLFIIFTVSAIGDHFGYTVDGVPQGGEVVESSPGILGVISWGFGAVGFLFHVMSFQVDGMPELMGMVFIIMSLISVVIFVSLFLPGGGGG